jgi:hypothetical protein
VRRTRLLGLALTTAAVATGLVCAPASASSYDATTVSAKAASWTPHVSSGGWVNKYAQVGSTMFVGGKFSALRNAARTQSYPRTHLGSFNATTGQVLPFSPKLDGQVWALASDGVGLYVGGEFKNADGLPRRGLVRYVIATGKVDPSFNAKLDGTVTDVQFDCGKLLVSGQFKGALRAVSPATGANTGYFNSVTISGMLTTDVTNAGRTKVYRFATRPQCDRMVIVGNFTSVGGQARRQAAQLLLGATPRVSGWYSPVGFNPQCGPKVPQWTRDVDYSPDGKFFTIVSAGGSNPAYYRVLCDSASRWDAVSDNSNASPVWAVYTPVDTYHSVTDVGSTIYIGGHFKAVGTKMFGPNWKFVKSTEYLRNGVAALNPTTGVPTSFDPNTTRGIGKKDLYLTKAGLWLGSDGEYVGGKFHEGIAFLPH